jgi:hypothetical protein
MKNIQKSQKQNREMNIEEENEKKLYFLLIMFADMTSEYVFGMHRLGFSREIVRDFNVSHLFLCIERYFFMHTKKLYIFLYLSAMQN